MGKKKVIMVLCGVACILLILAVFIMAVLWQSQNNVLLVKSGSVSNHQIINKCEEVITNYAGNLKCCVCDNGCRSMELFEIGGVEPIMSRCCSEIGKAFVLWDNRLLHSWEGFLGIETRIFDGSIFVSATRRGAKDFNFLESYDPIRKEIETQIEQELKNKSVYCEYLIINAIQAQKNKVDCWRYA